MTDIKKIRKKKKEKKEANVAENTKVYTTNP